MSAPAPRRTRVREWARTLVVVLGGWFLLRTFVVQAFHITSESMEGTLLVGDVLFVARPLYGAEVPLTRMHLPAIREPRHGDLVVFESVETPGLEVVKRVIGVPGDTLAMQQGVVLRNGRPLAEPYVVRDLGVGEDPASARRQMRAWQVPRLVARPAGVYDPDRNDWGPVVVPPDSLFVMGDNRDHSYDGRYWGFLPRRNVDGEPLLVYYSYDPASWRPLPLLTAVRWGRLFTVPR